MSTKSPKSPLQAENSTFFLVRSRTKSTTQNAPKHAISSAKFHFVLGRGHSSLQTHPLVGPTLNKPSGSTLRAPRIPARFTPLVTTHLDDIEDTWWNAGLSIDLRQHHCSERGQRRRLEYHRVASSQRRRRLPHCHL